MSFHEVIIKGGLGNQIFCLFYAYKLSLKYQKRVCLNISGYSFGDRKDRDFKLDSFYPPLVDEFKITKNTFAKALYLFTRIFEKYFVKPKKNYIPGDKPFYLNYWKNRYIHSGYFQKINQSKLDKKCIDLIKKRLNPYINKKKSNYLAIHIRRGDYLSNKHSMHGIIDQKYFLEEAKIQLSKNNYEGIIIFSDSPNLIKKNVFKKLHKNIILDRGGDPVDVFIRMANNKGLIASNSSFSLWAGILGDIDNFSIPYYWMKNIKSSILGLKHIKRYHCDF